MINLLLWGVILTYSVTAAIVTVNQLRGQTHPSVVGWWLVAGGWVVHGYTILHRILEGGFHLEFSLDHSLEAVAMMTAFLYLVDWRLRRAEARSVGLLLLPLIVLLLLASRLLPQTPPMVRELVNPWLVIHLLLSLLAYGLFTIAAILALLDSYQEHALRNKNLGAIFAALPPLGALEERLFAILKSGFAILTLSILTGAIYSRQELGAYFTLSHKVIFGWATWGVFGALLLGHRLYGWRGRRAVRFTLWGYLFLMLAYFGVKVVAEIILKKHV